MLRKAESSETEPMDCPLLLSLRCSSWVGESLVRFVRVVRGLGMVGSRVSPDRFVPIVNRNVLGMEEEAWEKAEKLDLLEDRRRRTSVTFFAEAGRSNGAQKKKSGAKSWA